jgi:biotin carboxyl carrier protein
MTFEVEIRGRTRSASIGRAGGSAGRYRAIIDGRTYAVDAVRVGDFGLSLLVGAAHEVPATFPGKVPATSVEVQITSGSRPGEVLIVFEGRTIAATMNGRRSGRTPDARTLPQGEQSVVAPMPGRVVRVLVTAGEAVAARQGVVVVEAMKMENELRAPKSGRVKDVSVTAGTSVEAGRVLVVIE